MDRSVPSFHIGGICFTDKHVSIFEHIQIHDVRLQVEATILLSLRTFAHIGGI